jgi:hypothetical protein
MAPHDKWKRALWPVLVPAAHKTRLNKILSLLLSMVIYLKALLYSKVVHSLCDLLLILQSSQNLEQCVHFGRVDNNLKVLSFDLLLYWLCVIEQLYLYLFNQFYFLYGWIVRTTLIVQTQLFDVKIRNNLLLHFSVQTWFECLRAVSYLVYDQLLVWQLRQLPLLVPQIQARYVKALIVE